MRMEDDPEYKRLKAEYEKNQLLDPNARSAYLKWRAEHERIMKEVSKREHRIDVMY